MRKFKGYEWQYELNDFYSDHPNHPYKDIMSVHHLNLCRNEKYLGSKILDKWVFVIDSLKGYGTSMEFNDSDFKLFSTYIKNDDNILQGLLEFFAKCEEEIDKEIKKVQHPIFLFNKHGFTVSDEYLLCPKTGVVYKCFWNENDVLGVSLEFLIVPYFEEAKL